MQLWMQLIATLKLKSKISDDITLMLGQMVNEYVDPNYFLLPLLQSLALLYSE